MKNIVIQEMTNKLYIDSVDSTKRLISAAFSFVLPVAQCNKFVKIGIQYFVYVFAVFRWTFVRFYVTIYLRK